MRRDPDCPAPPCLEIQAFLSWCTTTASGIDGFNWIHHEWSQFQSGFVIRSHLAAYDSAGHPLRCTRMTWKEPRALANVEEFLGKLRQHVRQKQQ